jgi:bifunctional enzyme CysN/CysC
MRSEDGLIATDVEAYLNALERKSLLRFLACGSVDDGKSTLIGRLLWESKMLFEDQIAALEADSRKAGTRGGDIDYALLLDGLSAEREQGITIDVACRFFTTDRRKFIVADTPGHEQYTRNMVTGASTADLAIILIDARKGVLVQTRRHSFLVQLLGIRHVVVAVNKMDLVDYAQDVFERIEADYRAFARQIGLEDVLVMPICGVHGDNLIERSLRTPWYGGPALMDHLETVQIDEQRLQRRPFRMPVQWVNRPNLDFRGFAGTVASGTIRPGDSVRVLPGGRSATVTRVVTADGDLPEAVAHQSVTLTLAEEMDVSRGDLLCAAGEPAQVADQFQATIVWMSEQPMLRGRSYLLKIGTRTVTATVLPLKHKIDINTLEHVAAERLELNEIGVAELELDRPIAFDPYRDDRETGGFVLIDRISNGTVGAGMLEFALRRADNIHWQAVEVDRAARRRLNGHGSAVIWLTGLSGAGKSTLANALERRLHARGVRTYLLDGDNVRHGLNKDLGFTAQDRVENIRRVAEVARLMVDAGVVVITAFISPFRAERRTARELMGPGEFIEVHVDVPLDVAERRDPKGLYKKARRGELKNFTGIDSPYEAPESPEIAIDTSRVETVDAVEQIYRRLIDMGVLDAP